MKAGSGHADHGKGMAIDGDALVQNARIGAKSALPIREAQHDDRVGFLRDVFGRDEQAPQCRLHSEDVEVIAGDQFRLREAGLVMPLHADLGPGCRNEAAEY